MPDQLCTRAPPRDMSGPKRPLTGAVSHERLLYCAAKRYSRMPPTLAMIVAKMSDTVLMTLMSGLIEGPAVSL